MVIYYDSKTGNVERFIGKIRQATDWQCLKISDTLQPTAEGHLVTFTTQIGAIPDTTLNFMQKHNYLVLSVSSSGNRNWGPNFALAGDKLSALFGVPLLYKFELSGLNSDVAVFIQKVKEYANQKVDTSQ